jgi:hypothetical protein
MTHAWCRDIARDAAVRAAEDNRTEPLPTLGECIDGMFPKSGSASSAVEQENKGDGMATDGLRTERVVLECVHRFGKPPREWDWWKLVELRPGESVRVVDGDITDNEIALTVERDAAIRERDELRGELERANHNHKGYRNTARARVADLEAQLESVADRAAAAETALEAAAKLAPDANDDGGSNHAAQAASGNSSAILTSSQAASGGGEGEAVAWGVEISGHVQACYFTKYWADRLAEEEKGTVVTLYRSPPQPRGWLSEEERDLIAGIADDDEYTEEGRNIARGLLARSSPPEVVLTEFPPNTIRNLDSLYLTGWNQCMALAKKAIAAAGVAVKEVGCE